MASKRKTNGRASVQCVMGAINKIGVEINDFFGRAKFLKYVPAGFNSLKEAARFKELRDKGIDPEHPDWGVPTGILDFADEINESSCPLQAYNGQKQYAPQPGSTPASAKGFRPMTMTRPAPSYT